MKPPPFDYADPRTVDEAVSLLQEHEGDAKILAGGQSLVPLLNMRLARPGIIVDIGKLAGLDYIRDDGDALAIGAVTSQRSIERSPLVHEQQPLLHAATRYIAHPQIRNRGTFGGSIAHADPAAEYPALAIALDMQMKAAGPNGERVIAAADFFVTYLTTVLEPSEMLTEIRVPKLPDNSGWSIQEFSRRRGDFALAGAIVTLTLAGGGSCSDVRIALFGAGATPLRAREAEQLRTGLELHHAPTAPAAQQPGPGLRAAAPSVSLNRSVPPSSVLAFITRLPGSRVRAIRSR